MAWAPYQRHTDSSPLSEGFYGYLAFRIHTLCVFCMIVFGFMVALGCLRLLEGENEVAAGFVSLAVVFSMLYLILPGGVSVVLPENERLVLFYSKDCKHCSEIMNEIEASKLSVKHLEVNGYSVFSKAWVLSMSPRSMNEKCQKIFLTGKGLSDAICRLHSGGNACDRNDDPKAPSTTTKSRPKAEAAGQSLDFFNQQGIIPAIKADSEGMAETEICKWRGSAGTQAMACVCRRDTRSHPRLSAPGADGKAARRSSNRQVETAVNSLTRGN
jgi:hypothetical protein